MTTVLLTGFEPFDGQMTNPSWSAVQEVAANWAGDETIHLLELPVVFGTSGDALAQTLREVEPDVVICVGQAGGQSAVAIERVAINVDDARIPDNGGAQPVDEPVVDAGPAAYFSTLPIKAALVEVTMRGIPAEISQSAGTFTCNHVFYRLMHELATGDSGARGGFVHVPFSPEQAAGTRHPSMSIEVMAEALAGILAATLTHEVDLRIGGGALN